MKEPVLTQDFGQAPLKVIASEVALHVPALSVYLTGSMARGFGGYRNDYDIIVVLKTLLVPLYLRRLKAVGRELSHKLGSRVEVNPLPTFRLRRAKGSLFLMKAKDEAKLLLGEDVLTHADTGQGSDISPDWYFSFYSSMLKDLLHGYETSDTKGLRAIAEKIAISLSWLSRHSRDDISRLVREPASDLLNLASSNEIAWLDIRERMIMLFRELTTALLRTTSRDLQTQIEALIRLGKGKSIMKNFEYGILLLMVRRELASLGCLFSRTLIQDRYRAALILLSAAASEGGPDADLTYRAYSIIKGCLKAGESDHPAQLWRNLRRAILDYWSFAQPVMGI